MFPDKLVSVDERIKHLTALYIECTVYRLIKCSGRRFLYNIIRFNEAPNYFILYEWRKRRLLRMHVAYNTFFLYLFKVHLCICACVRACVRVYIEAISQSLSMYSDVCLISCTLDLTNNFIYFQKSLVWMYVYSRWEDNIGEVSTKQ